MNRAFLRSIAIILIIATVVTSPSPLSALAAARRDAAAGPLSAAQVAALIKAGVSANTPGVDLLALLRPGLGADQLPEIADPAAAPGFLPPRAAYNVGGFLRHYRIGSLAGGALAVDGSGTEWHLLPFGDGSLEIQSTATGQCLDVAAGGGSGSPGLADFTGSATQKWRVFEVAGGAYLIASEAAPLYLAMIAGGLTALPQSDGPFPDDYLWQIELASDGTDAPGATFYALGNDTGGAEAGYLAILDTAVAGSHSLVLAAADDADAQQRWSFVEAGGGFYSIKSDRSELCLTAGDGGTVAGETYAIADGQRWRMVDAGDGWFRLFPASAVSQPLERVAAGSGFALRIAAGVADDPAQKWQVSLRTTSIATDLEEDDTDAPVFLFVRHTGLYAEPVADAGVLGSAVAQDAFAAGLTQQWRLTPAGVGFYAIVNEESNLALTAGEIEAGAGLSLAAYKGTEEQKWRFVKVEGAAYYAVLPKSQPDDAAEGTELYLSVAAASTDVGAALVLDTLLAVEEEQEEPDAEGEEEPPPPEITYVLQESQQWSFFRAESDQFAFTKYYPDLAVKYALGSYDIGRIYDPNSGRGAMGLGWHLAYQYAMVKDYNDDPATKVKVVRLPDGGKHLFVVDGATFSAMDSRNKLTLAGDEYQLTTPEQVAYRFDKQFGRLVGIDDKYGNAVVVAYDSDDEDALVTSIADATGRRFLASYSGGLLTAVVEQYGGESVRTITYGYSQGNLARVGGDAGKTVDLVYGYHGLLAEIRDANGDLIDGMDFIRDGKYYGRIMRTRDAMGNVRTYDYATRENDDGTVVSTVRITDALGLVKLNVNDRKTFIRTVTDYSAGGAVVAISETKYTTVSEGGKAKNKYDEPAYDVYNKFTTNYARDANGNVELTINPDGSVRIQAYNGANSLVADVDEEGFGTFNVYAADAVTLLTTYRYLGSLNNDAWISGDVLNRSALDSFMAGLSATNSAVVAYTYYTEHVSGLGGLVETMTDSTGVTTFTYNERGLVSTVTGPTGGTTTYAYGTGGLISRKESPGGRVTYYSYDGSGRLVAERNDDPWGDEDPVSTRAYDPSGRAIRDTNALGNSSTYRYWYGSSRAWVRTTPDGGSYVAGYDVYGNVVSETRPDGYVFSYRYDPLGRRLVAHVRSALGGDPPLLLEDHEYDDRGEGSDYTTETMRLHFSDYEHLTTKTKYDYAGRQIEQTSAQGTQYTAYYANGRVRELKDSAGRAKSVTYGPLCSEDNYLTMVEADGSWSEYDYDEAGRATELRSYDADDVLRETQAWQYDAGGNIVAESKDGVLRAEYEYDADTNLLREKQYLGPDRWRETSYTYNYLGLVASMTVWVEPEDLVLTATDRTVTEGGLVGLVTEYEYDLEGNLITESRPDGSAVHFTYDAMNRRSGESRGEYANSVVYDWRGNPVLAVDMNGNAVVYEYGPHGEETRAYLLVDGHLAVRAAYYDRAGRQTAEVLPGNFVPGADLASMSRLAYEYDEAGYLVIQRYIGTETTYDPIAGEWVQTSVDRVDRAFGYDAYGNVVKEIDAEGYAAAFGATVAEKIANGTGVTRHYDISDNLIAEGNLASAAAGLPNGLNRFTYDSLGRKTAEFAGTGLDASMQLEGLLTRYEYDMDGNATLVEFSAKAIEAGDTGPFAPGEILSRQERTYNFAGDVLSFTKPNGASEQHEYNMLGLLRKDTLSGDSTIPDTEVRYYYDAAGRLVRRLTGAVGSPDTREELFSYDEFDRLVSETVQRLGGDEVISQHSLFDGNGNKVAAVDGNGNLTIYEYNGLNRIQATIQRTGADSWLGTGYRYDRNGNPIESRWIVVTGSRYVERLERTTYDARGRKIAVTDTFGAEVQKINYSPAGRPVESFDALNNATRVEFDGDGREVQWIDAEGHTEQRGYDLAGRVVQVIDGNGNPSWTEYNAFGQIEAAFELIAGGRTQTMAAAYDASNNLVTRVDGLGIATDFAYNAADLLISRRDATGQAESVLAHNAFGNVLRTRDRNGAELAFTYDIHGRKTSQTSAGGTISFAYDGNGNLLRTDDASGTTTYTYDQLNRPLTKTVPGAGTFHYQYEIMDGIYHKDGAYADVAVDPKGNVTSRIYDAAGRLKTVKDGRPDAYDGARYEYYANGMRKSVAYQNGYSEEYEYYADGQLMTLRHRRADGSVYDEYHYTYDGAHNQTGELRIAATGPKATSELTAYVYDERSQVIEVAYGTEKTAAYTYDLAGNRLQEAIAATGSRSVTDYGYDDLGRLASAVAADTNISGKSERTTTTTTSYTYDRNGNQLEVRVNGKVTEQRQYDAYNRLMSTRQQNRTYSYTYDAMGSMVVRDDGAQITRYVHDGGQIVLELDRNGRQISRNLQGLNLLARTDQQSTYYYLYNGRGDVMGLVSSNGLVVREYQYDAFGNILDSFRERLNPFRHAGAFWDYQTGLYVMGSRMYDPRTARFVQEDYYLGDSEDALSLNLYSYCRNNPVKYVDPTGHFFITLLVLAVVGAVLAVGATLAADLIDDGRINTDWRIYVGAAVGGLLSGACAGAGIAVAAGLGATATGMAFAGAVAGAIGGVSSAFMQDLIDDGAINTDWRFYLAAGVTGAVLGMVGGGALGQTATAAGKETAKAAAKETVRQAAKVAIGQAAKRSVWTAMKHGLSMSLNYIKPGAIVALKEMAKGVTIAVGIKIVRDLIISGGFDLDWKSWVHTLVEGSAVGLVRGSGMRAMAKYNPGRAGYVIGGAAIGGVAAASARILSYLATEGEVNWYDVGMTAGLGAAAGGILGFAAYKAGQTKAITVKPYKPDPKASWTSNLANRFAAFRARADHEMDFQMYNSLVPKVTAGVSMAMGAWMVGKLWGRFESKIWSFGIPGDTLMYALPNIY